MTIHPKIRGHEIHDLVNGLHAYDDGSTDSGIKDDLAKEELRVYLESIDDRLFWAEHCRWYLSDEGVDQGYGMKAVAEISEWAESEGLA